MKNFTQARILSVSLCLLFVAMLFVSSCTSPQHFSFTAAPPTYHKVKKEAAEPQPEVTEEPTALSASTETEAIVLPEIAELTAKKSALATAVKVEKKKTEAQPKQKLTLAQKVVLKKLQKQATKLQNANSSEKATQAAGPVSSKSAIALILIGLIVAIFGLVLPFLYTLGVLILLIGLVLLILAYL